MLSSFVKCIICLSRTPDRPAATQNPIIIYISISLWQNLMIFLIIKMLPILFVYTRLYLFSGLNRVVVVLQCYMNNKCQNVIFIYSLFDSGKMMLDESFIGIVYKPSFSASFCNSCCLNFRIFNFSLKSALEAGRT